MADIFVEETLKTNTSARDPFESETERGEEETRNENSLAPVEIRK